MRKAIIQAFVLFSVIFSNSEVLAHSNCFSEAGHSYQQCEKTYIHPQQVAINEKGIFVRFENQWFQTEILHSDCDGIFINNLSPSAYGCPDPYVACRSCKRCIYEIYDICPFCKRPA